MFPEERYDFDKHGPALNKTDPPGGGGWPSLG
jgi:hypothetical protein